MLPLIRLILLSLSLFPTAVGVGLGLRTPESHRSPAFHGDECALPPVGERRHYRSALNRSNYLLYHRPSEDGVHHLEIAIAFHFQSLTRDPDVAGRMRTKVEECLADFSDHFRGSDGTRFSIRMANAEEVRRGLLPSVFRPHRLPRKRIIVSDSARRDSATIYRDQIECEGILHETLHLLGLVDEYEEKDETLGYGCRVLGPPDSPMNSGRMAVFAVRGGCLAKKTRIVCDFGATEPESEEVRAKAILFAKKGIVPRFEGCRLEDDGESAEADHMPLNRNGECELDAMNGIYVDDHEVIHPAFYVFKRTPPWRESYVYPAQFDKIVYPKCKTRNRIYDACAANAYRTAGANGAGCLKMQPECSNPQWLENASPSSFPTKADPSRK